MEKMRIIHKEDRDMKPALFIDRDGTINADCPYCHDSRDLKIYNDIIPFIRKYEDSGYLIIIVTNQSGINRGYFSLDQFLEFHSALINELTGDGISVNATYYCPHRPDEMCRCRKPNTGLVEEALKDFNIDLEKSVVAGDNESTDGELAKRLGLKFIKIDH